MHESGDRGNVRLQGEPPRHAVRNARGISVGQSEQPEVGPLRRGGALRSEELPVHTLRSGVSVHN